MELGTTRMGSSTLESGTIRGWAVALWRVERLQVKAKDLLKANFWTQATHQGLRNSLLADMTAQGTVSTDAAHDGVVEVVVNNKMRTMRYCKDKMGTPSAAHMVYIELGPEEPMDTIPVVLGGKLVADGTPCIVYGPNAKEQVASLQERQLVLATWQKTEIAVYIIRCRCNLRNSSRIFHTWL